MDAMLHDTFQVAWDYGTQVIPSRIGMAIPGMMIPPIIMSKLEPTATFVKSPWLKARQRRIARSFVIRTDGRAPRALRVAKLCAIDITPCASDGGTCTLSMYRRRRPC